MVAAIDTPVDVVVTAEQAQAYKPDHRLFLHAYATMGMFKEDTVHVGMNQFTDLKVCHELGIRSVWIDRLGETPNPDWPPGAVLPDLSGLPALYRRFAVISERVPHPGHPGLGHANLG